jgi:TonB family protein
MKNSVLISFSLHVFVIIFLLVWRAEPKRASKALTIYPVELVSMVQIKENRAPQKEEIKTIPKPEKPPVEEPINISKKNIKKPTEAKKEAPVESVPKPNPPATGASGGLKIDTKDFPFAYYLTILQNRVQNNWQPPFQAATQQERIATVVGFQVLRNGKIANVSVEESSGRYLFDQAAQRAVYSANPLPPLPDEFSGEFLSVHIEFEGIW